METPSHVLRAMKLPDDVIEGVLRIGIGKFTKEEAIYEAAKLLIQSYVATSQTLCS